MQAGSRAQNYQLAFTEPFLFDRHITGSVDLHRRDIRYIDQFTQESTGGNLTLGFPLALHADVRQLQLRAGARQRSEPGVLRPMLFTERAADDRLQRPDRRAAAAHQRNPFLRDSLLIGQGGRRIISKVTPSFVAEHRRQADLPDTGAPLHGVARIWPASAATRTTIKPTLEGVWFLQQTARIVARVCAAQAEYIQPFGTSSPLPIFEKLFLGGDYSVRGFDIRTIGPQDPDSGLVLGGNKSLLFNVEDLIAIAGPVRLILFYDAGQVQDTGQRSGVRGETVSDGLSSGFHDLDRRWKSGSSCRC